MVLCCHSFAPAFEFVIGPKSSGAILIFSLVLASRRPLVGHGLGVWENTRMSRTKKTSKRGRVKKALPAFGVAGVSLAIAGGASAATPVTAADTQSQNASSRHEIFLGEEEISDVSLSTFYVFDKEGAAKSQLGEKVAWGCGGCRGCGRGCRGCGWRGCRGCGGCYAPWCASRGGCHYC
jgi:hypothetical protein